MLSGAILISGASSGIGLDAAIHIVGKGSRRRGRAAGCADMSAGFTVFAGVRKAADGDAAVAECVKSHGAERCGGLVPVILDVTEPSTIEATHAAVSGWVAQHGLPLIAVVNNAGITIGGPAECTEMHVTRNRLAACDWPSFTDAFAVMEVNYFGAVALTKQFLPLIRASKGRIINVSSLFGVTGIGARGAYSASKFALEGFSDSLRKEVRPLGVAVSLVEPAYILYTRLLSKYRGKPGQAFNNQCISDYSRYFDESGSRLYKIFNSGVTTEVSSEAIADAAFNPRPKARYFVASFGGIPAVVIAFLTRVLPTYLMDVVIEAATAK